jgi:hypothetical protein
LPIKLLEYIAAGKVVVSTKLEEVRRIGFKNVIFVDANSESIAEGLRNALETKFIHDELIEKFDYELIISSFEKVLEDSKWKC